MYRERHMPLLAPLLVAGVYALVGILGGVMVRPLYADELVWLPEGVALAAVILYGRRAVLGVPLAGAAIALWLGWEPVPAVIVGVASMLGVLAGARAATSEWRKRPALRSLADVVALWRGSLVTAVVSGVLVSLASVVFGRVEHGWLLYLREFVMADALGVVLVTPVVLALFGPKDRSERTGTTAEYVFVLVFLVLGSFLTYLVDLPGQLDAAMPYFLGPLLLLLVLRFGWRETTGALMLMAPVAFASTAQDVGPFVSGDVHESRLALQVAFIGAALMAHLIVVLMSERRGIIRELEAYRDELEERVRTRTQELVVANKALTAEMVQRRRVEVELRHHRMELEEMVQDRTASLEAVNRQLTTAMRTKAQFLANVSHELRTPLNSIIGFSDVLLGGMAGELNDEQWRQLSMINNSGRHLLALVNDVLDLTKMDADAVRLHLETVLVAPIVSQVIDSMTPIASEKGLKLESHIDGSVKVCTDVMKFKQVLINLVGNAIKFTPDGGVRIVGEQIDGRVCLEVTDTGIGIDPDELHAVFDEFHQSRSPETGKPTGTGLGLAISRRLARMLGGELTVDSVLGRGSTFIVSLPVTCEGEHTNATLEPVSER